MCISSTTTRSRALTCLITLILLGIQPLWALEPIGATSTGTPHLRLGGALRFGYRYAPWSDEHRASGGQLVYDVLRLNIEAQYRQWALTADYRLYATPSGGPMLKHGYASYTSRGGRHQLQLGLVPVPFGVMPYGSNSFLFNLNYLLGLEDDADMGLRYIYRHAGWVLNAAFYKNADWHSSEETSVSRFGFDIGGRNKEVNQLNLSLERQWGEAVRHRLGASAMVGGIYNLDTHRLGSRVAAALHYTLDYKQFALKSQYTLYAMNSIERPTLDTDHITMTAFGASHRIASRGATYMLGLSYRLPSLPSWLDELCLYNDWSMIDKGIANAYNSTQNILGCFASLGPIQIYADWALASNHPDIGLWNIDGFVEGLPNPGWQSYFYINLGYYF